MPGIHKPGSFLVPLARMGRAGSSSSSVPSSSPSLSLSDERAAPEDSTDGASCLSPRQGRSWGEETVGKENDIMGLHVRSRYGGYRAAEWQAQSKGWSSKMTASNLDAHPLLALPHPLFSPIGSSSPLGRGWSLLLDPSLPLPQLGQTLPHADGHLRAQAPHKYAAG